MLQAIYQRRSIRKYKDLPVPKKLITEVLQAGLEAPSAKNRQPWRFIVTTGEAKERALDAMEAGILKEEQSPRIEGSKPFLADAKNTLRIMRQAPVVIYISDGEGQPFFKTDFSMAERLNELCNIQSIGGSIENMALAAVELGLGTLWICNTYFACDELQECLHNDGELVAALALGYPDEDPSPRPRKPFDELIRWMED